MVPVAWTVPIVPRRSWEADRERYLAHISPWVVARLNRRSRHEKHPVHDFLFEYYEFRTSQLLRWTPGFDVILAGAARTDIHWPQFESNAGGLILHAGRFPEHRVGYLKWAIEYLESTGRREPAFGCAGLHEWAMVYREPAPRHERIPLRLSRPETDAVVESLPLACTHFDAFRFFSRPARPLNRWNLSRAETTARDQPGCLHVNMDLYRFAYKIAPFCPSELLAVSFELALQVREIDMRASPYELRDLGYSPIPIETPEGRVEYARCQREMYRKGQPIRARLLALYRRLLDAKKSVG
jgi:hypothetical protein